MRAARTSIALPQFKAPVGEPVGVPVHRLRRLRGGADADEQRIHGKVNGNTAPDLAEYGLATGPELPKRWAKTDSPGSKGRIESIARLGLGRVPQVVSAGWGRQDVCMIVTT